MPTISNRVDQPGEIGFFGDSVQYEGVRGESHAPGHGGVVGVNYNTDTDGNNNPLAGPGVYGEGNRVGVEGHGKGNAAGVVGVCDGGDGVLGVSHAAGKAGVAGVND